MCKATVIIFFIIKIVSIVLWPVSTCRASQAVSVYAKRGTSGVQLVLFEPPFKMLSTFKILFKNYVFLESDAVWLWRIGQSQKKKPKQNKKISWIVRRRNEPPRKNHLFSNRCRKVTRRGLNIFAAYELFRIFWFFIWYNANKYWTCIAIVTRRWKVAEMTRNSVNFYAILNETLF